MGPANARCTCGRPNETATWTHDADCPRKSPSVCTVKLRPTDQYEMYSPPRECGRPLPCPYHSAPPPRDKWGRIVPRSKPAS